MADSPTPHSTASDQPGAPIARPDWRFSGRRGTPVHLREQAPATLPPEIRKAVERMAAERRTEAPAQSAPNASPATEELTFGANRAAEPASSGTGAPPVAGAPVPVERRAPRTAPDAVTTSIPPAVASVPLGEPAVDEPIVEASRERHLFAGDLEVDPAAERVSVEPTLAETLEQPPVLALETTRDGAWELGRLPFLLNAGSDAGQDETTEQESQDEQPARPRRLQPRDWGELEPSPAAARGAAEPRAESEDETDPVQLPPEIARLQQTLETARSLAEDEATFVPRAPAREELDARAAAKASRRRIAARRAELDRIMASLGHTRLPSDRDA